MSKVLLPNGLLVHYERVGYGPPVVMIHGLTGNLAVWHLKIVPYLWDEFEILTYDLRGHGYTQMTPTGYSAAEMAGDLKELLDELGVDQPALVGHSFGADIALYFAYHYPERVRQVVAVEAALPALIHLRSREDWPGWSYWAHALAQSGVEVAPERRCDLGYLLRQSLQVPKKWGPLNGLPRNPKPYLKLIDTTTIAQDYDSIGDLTLENIARIETPVLLIYDSGSAFTGSCEYLQEHLPNANTIMLPPSELGHFGPMEQPDLLAQHLLTALRTPALQREEAPAG